MADRSIRVRLIADVQSYKAAMASAGASTKDFGREISGQGSATAAQMEKVGRSALLMAGVIGAGLGLSAKAALDWESAWAGVTKTVDGSASEMASLEEGLRGLASELPATHAEIAGVAEAAGQLGIQREAIVGFTETMVALGETTNLTADQAATAMAQMANIMQTPQSEVDRMGASLVALGNAGASTESQILDMSLRLAGAGRLIGASESDVLALANAMASVGIEAQLGGGSMSRVMQKIYSAVKEGGEALDGFAEISGMSSAEFSAAWQRDPVAAIDAFVQGLNQVEGSGGNVVQVLKDLGIKGTEETSVLLRLKGAGDLLAESLDLGAESWEENSALAEEAEKRYATTAAQMEIFRNNVVELAIDIGGMLLPVLSGMVEHASSAVRVVSDLPDPVKKAATMLGVLATAGFGVVGMIGTLAPKIIAGREALEAMGTTGQMASRGLGAFGRGVGRLAPAAGVVAGLLLLRETLGTVADEAERTDLSTLENELLDLAESGEFAGETLERITDGLGRGDASKAMEQFKADVDQIDQALAQLAGRDPETAAAAYDAVIAKFVELGATTSEAESHFQAYDAALADVDTSQRLAGDAAGALGAGLDPIPTAAEEAEDAIDAFNDEIDRLLGAAFDFQEAADALEQGIIDAGTHFAGQAENLGQPGLALEGNSQAALDNREVMRGLIEQSTAVLAAAQAEGQTVEGLTLIREAEKQKLRELAARYGLNEDQVEGYIAVLDSIPLTKTTEITAVDSVSGVVDRINEKLAAMQDKTVTVRTNVVTTGPGGSGGVPIGNRWGAITSYASGGVDAHIGHGDLIRYAEPETGGEAYIPRLGDAARSTKVLQKAASWYGLAVVPTGGYGQMTSPAPSGPGAAPLAQGGGQTTIQSLVLQTPDSPRQWLDEASWRMAPA